MDNAERFLYLGIIIILISFTVTNNCNENDWPKCAQNKCAKLWRNNLRYGYGSLLLCLIVIATSKYGDNTNIEHYLSFAGTLSSIILSVIAIFMSINSESKMDDAKVSIECSKDKIEQTMEKLVSLENKFECIERNVANSANISETSLKKIDEKLEGNMKELKTRIFILKESIEAINKERDYKGGLSKNFLNKNNKINYVKFMDKGTLKENNIDLYHKIIATFKNGNNKTEKDE